MWINLFQDALAALALATDPPSKRVLESKPEPRMAPLVDIAMWKTIVGQSVYQLGVTYALYFIGPIVFPYETDLEILQCETLVFNAYVWMQIFSLFK
jgi:Ca2+-transporting ATPase